MRDFNDTDFESLLAEERAGFLQHIRHATDIVEQHVTPVLTLVNSRKLLFEGSGFFARLKNRFYLVTAAHVLDACEYGVYLPALMETTGLPLSQDAVLTGRKPGQSRDDDRFDVGFIRLNDDEVERIGIQRFLDLNSIQDPLSIDPTEESVLMIALGYPSRDQVVDRESKSITPKLTMFTTGIAEEKGYRLAKVDTRSHILLRFRPEDILWNHKTVGAPPRFNGMSGGGVWMMSIHHDDYSLDAPPPFAAMVIERPASYKPSILATRSPLIRYFIQRFDDSKSTAVELSAQGAEQQERITTNKEESLQIQALSFYWYPSEVDFNKMKLHAKDSAKLHGTYTAWLAAAEYGFKEMQTSGIQQIVKIESPTDEFLAWCKTNNRNVNAASRNSFSQHKLRLLIKAGKIKLTARTKD